MSTAVATVVKERPILFSALMVRAILEGRKTQTRRVIKPQPLDMWMTGVDWSRYYVNGKKALWLADPTVDPARNEIICPYGVPGDRLWVRETWMRSGFDVIKGHRQGVSYLADCPDAKNLKGSVWIERPRDERIEARFKWLPSIFMPRWASRITLEVVTVRVERVQDISATDAITEGVTPSDVDQIYPPTQHVNAYRKLWDALNAKRGHGWDTNPWVWVIEFKRVTGAL